MIRPMPERFGIGFSSDVAFLPEMPRIRLYRYEQVGRHHNYHFTRENWGWPEPQPDAPAWTIDGFSPNLNKQLHVGHLRNLAIATALQRFLLNSKFVALLGHCLGVVPEALENLHHWMNFVNYHPQEFSDLEMTEKAGIKGVPGEGEEQAGCEVWKGIRAPVIIRRSNGVPTYAMHDLAFAKIVSPNFYLTGAEQSEHFASLGFESKHLPMGLVLDPITGKKMASRDGTSLSANEAMELVISKLSETPEPRKLAWNILSWNFLHCGREQNVKFNVEDWTKPQSEGMYISYSYARVGTTIKAGQANGTWKPDTDFMKDSDLGLLGYCSYFDFYRARAVKELDPAPLAKYAGDLARKLGSVYHEEEIANGRPPLQRAIAEAYSTLGLTMEALGLFRLAEV